MLSSFSQARGNGTGRRSKSGGGQEKAREGRADEARAGARRARDEDSRSENAYNVLTARATTSSVHLTATNAT